MSRTTTMARFEERTSVEEHFICEECDERKHYEEASSESDRLVCKSCEQSMSTEYEQE